MASPLENCNRYVESSLMRVQQQRCGGGVCCIGVEGCLDGHLGFLASEDHVELVDDEAYHDSLHEHRNESSNVSLVTVLSLIGKVNMRSKNVLRPEHRLKLLLARILLVYCQGSQ